MPPKDENAGMAVPPDPGPDHTSRKREELLAYVDAHLAPHPAVRGVVAIGSVATGLARADSDVDAVVFLEPVDPYLAPAEAIWRPDDDTFHSIFADVPRLSSENVQLDLHRLDLAALRAQVEWPEHLRSELADGWTAFDRTGEVHELVAERCRMSEQQRLAILDEVLVEVAGLLPPDPGGAWSTLGPEEAFDRLQAAYEALARGLFADDHRWRPWRSRSLRGLLRLPRLPATFRSSVPDAVRAGGGSRVAHDRRARTLRTVLEELLDRLRLEEAYGPDPVSAAFRRLHDEPGRAWNLQEWNRRHDLRRRRPADPPPT